MMTEYSISYMTDSNAHFNNKKYTYKGSSTNIKIHMTEIKHKIKLLMRMFYYSFVLRFKLRKYRVARMKMNRAYSSI